MRQCSESEELRSLVEGVWLIALRSESTSQDASNTGKLNSALDLVLQARDLAILGEHAASWMRLVGALDFLGMTGAMDPELSSIRKKVEAFAGGLRPAPR